MHRESKSPLPCQDGVTPCRELLPEGPWPRLGDFLRERFPQVHASAWRQRFAAGRACDGQGARLDYDQHYTAGLTLYYYREPAAEDPIPFREEILYQDEDLLVADKPHFLPVIPAGRFLRETLLVRLRQRTGLQELTPVHRLDRETAGLVLFSCRPSSRAPLTALFSSRAIHKTYEALAPWRDDLELPRLHQSRIGPGEPFFRMAQVSGEANAQTRIELVERRGSQALYRLQPLSGRKHQLRVHMAALGIPIIGDRLYPQLSRAPDPEAAEDFSQPLKLLARELEFTDPKSGLPRCFRSRREL